jgi:hypothetical protein
LSSSYFETYSTLLLSCTMDKYKCSSYLTVNLYSSIISPSAFLLSHSSLAYGNYYSTFYSYEINFFRFHIQQDCVVFICVCLISFNLVSSRFSHVINDRMSSFYDWIVFHVHMYHIFFIHASVNGHLGLFHIWLLWIVLQ